MSYPFHTIVIVSISPTSWPIRVAFFRTLHMIPNGPIKHKMFVKFSWNVKQLEKSLKKDLQFFENWI